MVIAGTATHRLLLSNLAPKEKRQYKKLEQLQKMFPLQNCWISQSNYWNLLKILTVSSLEFRRERCVIIYTWCMLKGHVLNIVI